MILTIQSKHITLIAMLHNEKCHYFKYPWYSIQFVKYSRVFWVVWEPILCPGFLFIFKWIAISKRLSNSRAFLELLTKAYLIWSMPVKCLISFWIKADALICATNIIERLPNRSAEWNFMHEYLRHKSLNKHVA